MWEANVRTTVSKIIANLNEQHPDEWWDGMADMVSDLDADNAFETNEGRHVESEASPPVLKNQRASDIHAELESFEAALREHNGGRSLEHAHAILQILQTKP
jgi:hypothetical protein